MQPELQAEIEAARTAALACHTLAVELVAIAEELKQWKVNLSLELQVARDQRVAEHRGWREYMAELRRELERIKADFRTEATLLHLIEAPKAGDFGDGTQQKGRERGREAQRADAETRGNASHG